MKVSNSYVLGLVFLRLGVKKFLRFGVGNCYVSGIVFSHLGVSNSYVWGIVFLSLGVRFRTFEG